MSVKKRASLQRIFMNILKRKKRSYYAHSVEYKKTLKSQMTGRKSPKI